MNEFERLEARAMTYQIIMGVTLYKSLAVFVERGWDSKGALEVYVQQVKHRSMGTHEDATSLVADTVDYLRATLQNYKAECQRTGAGYDPTTDVWYKPAT